MKNDLASLKPGDVVICAQDNLSWHGQSAVERRVAKVGRKLIHLDQPSRSGCRGYDKADGRERSDWPSYIRTTAFHAYALEKSEALASLREVTARARRADALSVDQIRRIIAIMREAP